MFSNVILKVHSQPLVMYELIVTVKQLSNELSYSLILTVFIRTLIHVGTYVLCLHTLSANKRVSEANIKQYSGSLSLSLIHKGETIHNE